MANQGDPNARDAIEQRAVDYLLALTGSPTDALRREVEEWLRADPAHAVAYARAERAWDMAGNLSAPPTKATPAPIIPPAQSRFTRRHMLGAGAIAASIAGFIGFGWLRDKDSITTAVGEIRDVALPDGSVMHLNTNSRVVVAMSDTRRLVKLMQGEAYFDVAHNPAVPFDVEADGATVRALGTAFNVRVRASLVELTVTEGLVGVRTARGMSEQVPAGQGAFIQPQTLALARLQDSEMEQRTLWRTKVIELNGESLAQAVDEFNRYRAQPMVIGDQRIAPLRVGGRFRFDEVDQFLSAVRQTLPVETIVQGDGGILLLYRDADSVAPTPETSGAPTSPGNGL